MTRRELLLVAMASGGASEYTPVQIQKLMFLIEKNIGERVGGERFQFVAYDYGPFDASIYEELRALKAIELVNGFPTSRGWEKYSLSPGGVKQGIELSIKLEAGLFDYMKQISEFVRSLSFSSLVSAVYKAYPEMKVNSVFRG
jgi:hypothetical protein